MLSISCVRNIQEEVIRRGEIGWLLLRVTDVGEADNENPRTLAINETLSTKAEGLLASTVKRLCCFYSIAKEDKDQAQDFVIKIAEPHGTLSPKQAALLWRNSNFPWERMTPR